MKKKFFILTVFILATLTGLAQFGNQKSAEVGVFLGCSYYIGDLNPLLPFNRFTKPAGGGVFRYNFNPRLSARANVLHGSIEGNDSFSKFPAQQQRNLSFKSKITEVSAQLEFNFLNYQIGDAKQSFSPYIFIGLAGFKFNPQGKFDDSWVNLQPLGTEGQGLPGGSSKKKYKLLQVSIPFGIGAKFALTRNIGFSVEWGMRKTYTDYLDDVSKRYYDPAKLAVARGAAAASLSDPSVGTDPNYTNVGRQRGNPTTKDWYSFAGVLLTIKLKQKEKCPGFD